MYLLDLVLVTVVVERHHRDSVSTAVAVGTVSLHLEALDLRTTTWKSTAQTLI